MPIDMRVSRVSRTAMAGPWNVPAQAKGVPKVVLHGALVVPGTPRIGGLSSGGCGQSRAARPHRGSTEPRRKGFREI